MELDPGTVVDRYVVETRIAEGASVSCFHVRHRTLGTGLVLEVYHDGAPALWAKMRGFARALARIRHPNVVGVVDLIDLEGCPALVIERAGDPTLADRLAALSLPLPWSEVDAIARGILRGVGEAHRRGVVHGDLGAGRILITTDDRGAVVPRVAGFGLPRGDAGVEDDIRQVGDILRALCAAGARRPGDVWPDAPERMVAAVRLAAWPGTTSVDTLWDAWSGALGETVWEPRPAVAAVARASPPVCAPPGGHAEPPVWPGGAGWHAPLVAALFVAMVLGALGGAATLGGCAVAISSLVHAAQAAGG